MTTAGTSATSRNRKRRPVAPRRLEPGSRAATKRIAEARALLEECSVCPRDCGAHRLDGEIGTCRTGADLVVASANLHHGEEPPISGFGGSGTVFLSGCSMRCTYCQNYPISQQRAGSAVSIADVAGMMLDLQRRGVHNINLVTPTHFTPQLIQAVLRARTGGLTVPIVWNTSGYERVETLRLLDGIVDIYLADMRYGDAAVAKRYSGVEDYPPVNRAAIAEMHRQVGDLTLNRDGIAVRGLLVRHLVLPGGNSGSAEVFNFLADEISPKTVVSLMSQYFPAYRATGDPVLGRRLTRVEYDAAIRAFERSGLANGYRQDLS
jgi:putative pyruvate formate lyase activating enzyme